MCKVFSYNEIKTKNQYEMNYYKEYEELISNEEDEEYKSQCVHQ